MKNSYRVDGETIWILVAVPKQLHNKYPAFLETCIDADDLPKLLPINCTWTANPAKAPEGKFYINAKRWDKETQKSSTILLHRIVMGEPHLDSNGTAIEVHHSDNDGLNNRKANLTSLSHQGNMRAAQPTKDWSAYDAIHDRIAVFKKLVAVGAAIASEFDLTRQHLYSIRRGHCRKSQAAKAYWNRVTFELPELFAGNNSFPWVIIRPFWAERPKQKREKGYIVVKGKRIWR